MAAVKSLRVHSIELPHALGQIGLWGFKDEVIMVGHQAIGIADTIEPATDMGIYLKEEGAVGLIEKMSARALPRAVT